MNNQDFLNLDQIPKSAPQFLLAQNASDFAKATTKQTLVLICKVGRPGNPEFTEAFGTGFLLELDGVTYCVTAKHVLNPEFRPEGFQCFTISPGFEGQPGIEILDSQRTYATSSNRDDVVCFALNNTQLHHIKSANQLHPCSLDKIDFCQIGPNGLRNQVPVFIAGYPWKISPTDEERKRISAGLLIHLTTPVAQAPTSYAGFDTARDLAFSFNIKGNFNHSGQITVSPDPHGMSGSPLWMYGELAYRGLRIPTLKLVGICRRYLDEEQVIIATDIRVALGLVANVRSALQEKFDHWRPDWRLD